MRFLVERRPYQTPQPDHEPFSCGQYPDTCCAVCYGLVEDDVERGRRAKEGIPQCDKCGRYLPMRGGCTNKCSAPRGDLAGIPGCLL